MNVCRICGGTEVLKCFQGNEQLTELLTVCANITVKEDDILPKHICEQCEFGLRFSYRLRKQSEETEKRLRQGIATAAISTTSDIQDTIVLDDEELEPPSVTVTSQKRLASDLSVNICTSTNEIGEDHSIANTVPTSPQEIFAAKRLRLGINEQQVSTSANEIGDERRVEVLNENDSHVLFDEKRLQLELRQRGVFMCTRLVAENKGLVYTQQVIAEKRLQLEYDAQSLDEYTNEEIQLDEEVDDSHFDVNEANDCGDVIELIDDDSIVLETPQQGNPHESDYEKLNASESQNQDIIEEILSSDEDEANRNACGENANQEYQANIVYETLDDECEESIDIDECQIHFTKEERADSDCDEYLENESNKTQENEGTMDDGDSTSQERQEEKGEETSNEVVSGTSFKMYKGKVLSYNCHTCNLVFDTHREYRDHVKTHGDKRFCCMQCNKWFPQLSRLERHAKSHQSNEERLQCPHCERTYRSRCNLTRHIRTVHEQKSFVCIICGEVFGRADILKNHMAKHTNDREYQCDKCPVRFKTRQSLTKHIRMHEKVEEEEKSQPDDDNDTTAKKTYYCHFCGKVSKHHFTHKMHMRIHSQDRPHKCEACGKSFRTLAALITHERIHDDARPYQCEHCLLSFRQQGHLKEHRMIHEGITPHVCSICELAFTKKNNMLVHMRIHSGENPYKCVTCGEQFKKSEQLRKHKHAVHNEKDKETEKLDEAGHGEELYGREDEEEGGDGEEGEEAQEYMYENDHESCFADLVATELLCSDSNSLEVIEEENVRPLIDNNAIITNEIAIHSADITAEVAGVTKRAELDPAISNNFSDDFNVDDGNGVVLVVDDNAKFNSLFIMDD